MSLQLEYQSTTQPRPNTRMLKIEKQPFSLSNRDKSTLQIQNTLNTPTSGITAGFNSTSIPDRFKRQPKAFQQSSTFKDSVNLRSLKSRGESHDLNSSRSRGASVHRQMTANQKIRGQFTRKPTLALGEKEQIKKQFTFSNDTMTMDGKTSKEKLQIHGLEREIKMEEAKRQHFMYTGIKDDQVVHKMFEGKQAESDIDKKIREENLKQLTRRQQPEQMPPIQEAQDEPCYAIGPPPTAPNPEVASSIFTNPIIQSADKSRSKLNFKTTVIEPKKYSTIFSNADENTDILPDSQSTSRNNPGLLKLNPILKPARNSKSQQKTPRPNYLLNRAINKPDVQSTAKELVMKFGNAQKELRSATPSLLGVGNFQSKQTDASETKGEVLTTQIKPLDIEPTAGSSIKIHGHEGHSSVQLSEKKIVISNPGTASGPKKGEVLNFSKIKQQIEQLKEKSTALATNTLIKTQRSIAASRSKIDALTPRDYQNSEFLDPLASSMMTFEQQPSLISRLKTKFSEKTREKMFNFSTTVDSRMTEGYPTRHSVEPKTKPMRPIVKPQISEQAFTSRKIPKLIHETKPKTLQTELCIESIPRSVYISSRKDSRRLSKLKASYRANLFDHFSFDQFKMSKAGRAYFLGVNQAKDILEVQEAEFEKCKAIVAAKYSKTEEQEAEVPTSSVAVTLTTGTDEPRSGSPTAQPSEEEMKEEVRLLFEERMKKLNAIVDLTEYLENDYIVPLSQLHFEKDQEQSLKYYERKKGSKSVVPSSTKSKPPPVEKHQKGSSQSLFRKFCRTGNIDKPDLPAPVFPIEKTRRIKKFVEEHKAKKAHKSMQHSFFHQFRKNEEILSLDIAFQRQLHDQTVAFRERRIKEKPHEEEGDTVESDEDFKSSRPSLIDESNRGKTSHIRSRMSRQISQITEETRSINIFDQAAGKSSGLQSKTTLEPMLKLPAAVGKPARKESRQSRRASIRRRSLMIASHNEDETCQTSEFPSNVASRGGISALRQLRTMESQRLASKATFLTLPSNEMIGAKFPPTQTARRSSIFQKKDLMYLIENINDTLGIKGQIKFDDDPELHSLLPEDMQDAEAKGELNQENLADALQNKDLMKCSKRQSFMEKKHRRLTEAIEQLREESALTDDPSELLTILEYMKQIKERDAMEHSNFLSKRSVAALKNDMNEKSEFIFKLKGKNYDLWKQNKLVLNKDVKELLEKTT